MHLFLLLAASMGYEENLKLLPRAPPLAHLPTCDVFLAPSSIPGSVCMNIRKKKKKQSYFTCCVGCSCSNIVSWITWLHRWYWLAAVHLKNTLIIILVNCFTPSNYGLILTAGFGVFAGRAFKQDEFVIRNSITLFLPKNFLPLSVGYYCFAHNDTHMAIPLDYGSLLNHHKSANTDIRVRNNNLHFQVREFFNVRITTF